MVEAAGVEPDKAAENTQLVDRGNARIGTNCITSKSAVQSLYSVLPEFPEHPTSTFGRPRSTESILKFVDSVSQLRLGRSGKKDLVPLLSRGIESKLGREARPQCHAGRELQGSRATQPRN